MNSLKKSSFTDSFRDPFTSEKRWGLGRRDLVLEKPGDKEFTSSHLPPDPGSQP